MDIFILLFPFTIFISLIGIIVLIWSIRSGQFEDTEREAFRILEENDQ